MFARFGLMRWRWGARMEERVYGTTQQQLQSTKQPHTHMLKSHSHAHLSCSPSQECTAERSKPC